MRALAWIAEQRITEAIQAGELDNLPGMGKPLDLRDAFQGDPALRMANTVLKNAGYVPWQVMLRKEIENSLAEIETLIANCQRKSQHYLNGIFSSWQVLSGHFGNQIVLRHYLEIKRVPDHFPIDKFAKNADTVKIKDKQLQKVRRDIRGLIRAYHQCLHRYRTEYEALLQSLNKKIEALRMEHVKEEVRTRKIVSYLYPAGRVPISKKLSEFDRDFQTFRLYELGVVQKARETRHCEWF